MQEPPRAIAEGAVHVNPITRTSGMNDQERQIITHFLSPNPDEPGTARATWQHSRDTSTAWVVAIASSTDPEFVALAAIPWLLLQVVGAEPGPTDGQRLTRTAFIQRLHTSGGMAPLNGGTQSPDVGQRAFVPYTADYLSRLRGRLVLFA
jgi:uncharacterized protein DUF3455